MILSNLSVSRLRGVHPDLVRVVRRCAANWKDAGTGFIVTCGVRTLAEQKVLVAKGASKTLRSRHIPAANGYSHAVDLAATIDSKVRWDWNLYIKIANHMKAAATAEKVPVEWGGTWALINSVKGPLKASMLHRRFPDGPHFQLPWSSYPGKSL